MDGRAIEQPVDFDPVRGIAAEQTVLAENP
jgi:hypothetical protein